MSEVNVTQKTYELLSRLPKTRSHRMPSFLHPIYGTEHLIKNQIPPMLSDVLVRAHEAYELAVSYRDFKVGAAIVGMTFDPSDHQIITGANMKPDEESSMNVHAEQTALQIATDDGFDAISIVAVVGNTQEDKQSGNKMPTLHPCGLCREALWNSPLVDRDRTLFVSTDPEFSTMEFYNLRTLRAFHETHDASGIQQFDLPPLPTILGAVDKTVSIHRHVETPQHDIDDRVWMGTVGLFLVNREIQLLNELYQDPS